MNNSNNTKLGDLYAVMSIPNETQLGHVKTEEELKVEHAYNLMESTRILI